MDGLYTKRNGWHNRKWVRHTFVIVVWQMMFEICGSKFGKVCPIREERKCHTEVVVAPVIWQLIITAHFLEIQSPLYQCTHYSFMNRLVVLCRHDDCLARSNVWCGRISRAWRISHALPLQGKLTWRRIVTYVQQYQKTVFGLYPLLYTVNSTKYFCELKLGKLISISIYNLGDCYQFVRLCDKPPKLPVSDPEMCLIIKMSKPNFLPESLILCPPFVRWWV